MIRSGRVSTREICRHAWKNRDVCLISGVIKLADGVWPRTDLTTPTGLRLSQSPRETQAHLGHDRVPLGPDAGERLGRAMNAIQAYRLLRLTGISVEAPMSFGCTLIGDMLNTWGMRRSGTTYHRVMSTLDQMLAGHLRRHGTDRPMVDDIRLLRADDALWVEHPEVGSFRLMNGHGLAHREMTLSVHGHLARALSDTTVQLAPPPVTAGNARMARILRLCHDAIVIDPEIRDRSGTSIRPLLEMHVPELFSRHQAASQVASDAEIQMIDEDLETGIEIVTQAVAEALSACADERCRALSEQIAFLQLRHPPEGTLRPAMDRTTKIMEKDR